jgi:hypothetical protein
MELPRVRLAEDSESVSRITRGALVMATYVWCAATVLCLIGGVGLLMAVSEATLAATGSLTAWAIYRRISGLCDGLVIITIATIGPERHILDSGPGKGILPTVLHIALLIVSAPIFGAMGRAPDTSSSQSAFEQYPEEKS